MSDLDARLRAAHDANDIHALIDLYQEAAAHAQNADARGFYLTHAYVFALELEHQDASALRAALVRLGREAPL